MTQLKRQIDSFGPKLVIESGSDEVGVPGRATYQILSTNDSGFKYNQSHHENGISRFYSDGKIQVEAMAHPSASPSDTGMAVIVHKGNIGVDANSGDVSISGKNVTIHADETLVLKGNRIQIGESKKASRSIDMMAHKIHLHSPKDGNMSDVLKTRSFLKAYAGSLVSVDKLLSTSSAASVAKGALSSFF